MLDNIRIRKLTNGFTVKFHLQFFDEAGKETGRSEEFYVPDRESLIGSIEQVIRDHVDIECLT